MPNRYICTVLEEMRTCYKTRNFSYLLGLIEEAQFLAERMESALGDKSDFKKWHEKASKEKEEYRKLLAESNKLRRKKGVSKKSEDTY